MSDVRWSWTVDRALVALSSVSGLALAIPWWGTVLVLGQPRLWDQPFVLVILPGPNGS